MYTLVVMAALTTGGEAPDFGWRSGCYGCYGYGCYGAACHGCHGCYGSWSCWGCSGCHGCYGSWSCWGCYGCWGTSPYFPMHHESPTMPPAEPEKKKPAEPEKKKTSIEPSRARLIVEVPADARLFIDDQPTKATAPSRTFTTPTLQAGETYYYILRVEVEREKVTHSETRRILIRAGDEVKASFTETSIVAASQAGTTAAR